MNRLMFASVILLLPLALAACNKPEPPSSRISGEVVPPVPANAARPDQAAAALQAQTEQLMLMQLRQMQQQIAAQNISHLGQIGTDASEQVYRQGVVNGCYLQGNCTVRTVTIPAQ